MSPSPIGLMLIRTFYVLIACAIAPELSSSTLTLDQCVELAQKNNKTLEIACSKTERVIAIRNEMSAGRFPSVSIEGVIDNRNHSLSGDLTQFQDFHATKALGMSAKMGLWDFGVTAKRLKASKYRIDASEYQREQLFFEVEEQVRVSYLKVLEKEKAIEVVQASLDTLDQQLNKSKALLEQGIVKNTDVLSLQVQLADKERRLIQLKNEAVKEQMRLNQLIGLPINEVHSLKDLEEKTGTFSCDESTKYAFKARPDLKAYNNLLVALRMDRSAMRWTVAPQFFAFANGNYSPDGSTISAGVGMRMDLYEGGLRSARVQKIDAEIHELEAIVEDLENFISIEIQNTCLQFEEIEKGMQLNKQAVSLAEENLRSTQDLYRQGFLSMNDLLAALEQLTLAKMNYFSNLYRYYMNEAHLVAITGGYHA